jgi:hypothetical protein
MDVIECKKGMIVRSVKNKEGCSYKIMRLYKNTSKVDVITNDRFGMLYPLVTSEVFYETDEPDKTIILS